MAVHVADEVEVEEYDTEAAARSRRAMERCTHGADVVGSVALGIISRTNKCLFGPGLDLMEWLREMNKMASISADFTLNKRIFHPRARSALS